MSTPLNVGVVGAGGIAPSHLAAWKHLGARLSIFSIDDRAPEVAARFGATVCESLDDLLETADTIDVCTPTFAHHEIVLAAARAGRDVVCEKPLARTHDQAVAMIDACRSAGVRLYPGQVVRFFPEYAAAKQAVDGGTIGTPAVLRFSRRGAAPSREWFHDTERSGGIIVDQMIHDIDYARWVAGEVERVFARVTGGGDQPTTAYVVLTHDSGTLTHITGAWGHPATVFRTNFSLSGSSGLLEHNSTGRPALSWDLADAGPQGGGLLPADAFTESPFLIEIREFAAALAGGPAPRVTAEDGLAALDIALAALESAQTGRAVSPKEMA